MSRTDATRAKWRPLGVVVLLLVLGGAGLGAITTDPDSQTRPSDAPAASTDDASIDIVVDDPVDVRSPTGEAGPVRGAIDGSLTTARTPDRIELTVQSRLPNGEWVVVARETWRADDGRPFDLGGLLGGSNVTYLDADQSDGFDVPTPGSFTVFEGAVSVTARVFDGGGLVASVSDSDAYEFTVEHLGGAVVNAGEGVPPRLAGPDGSTDTNAAAVTSGGGGGGAVVFPGEEESASRPRLSVERASALFGVSDVLPGDAREETVTVTSGTNSRTILSASVGHVSDDENGLTEPESEVDTTPSVGELSDHLELRLFVEQSDGSRQYLVGDARRFVRLTDLSGSELETRLAPRASVAFVAQWRLDRTVGNEIQSDGVTLTVHLTLTRA